ncbi:MAG: LysE family translocator [Enterobacteriaceae bacterium]|jgi:threonine/homoserine/homoserine lactone efflux protein|nr:LysE family translocator [Enterobacteriaceae bacterium]
MPLIETLITFISISTLLCFSPGPDNIFVLSQSAINGRMAGVLITIGLCIGLIIHSLLISLGISAIVRENAIILKIIKTLGVIYLCYLAWGAFNAKPISLKNNNDKFNNSKVLIKKGIMMNLSNPKVIIFFLAFLPQFTNQNINAIPISFQLFSLGLIFSVIAFIVFSIISYLSGFFSEKIFQKPKVQNILNKTSAVIFVALAINLFRFE